MCAKNNLIRRKMLFQTHNKQLAGEPATAESVTAKDPNHVDTFSLDFAFSFTITISIRLPIARGNVSNAVYLSRLKADQHFFVYQNILSLIAFIISYRPFADKLNIQQSLLDRATVVPIIISVDKTQLSLILRDRSTPSTLLAKFIPTTKIRDPLLKTLENAAKSRILLACADRRIRQYYPTICVILANYEEQVLLTSIKKNRYCTRYTKHYNFNIHVSLATDTLHLLLKGLVIKMLDFMQDMLDNIYPSKQKAIIQQLIAIISLLFVSKAPFALHFIRAVCDLVTLAQYKKALERINVFKEEFQVYQQTLEEKKNFNYPKALDSICTRANSKAYYITIVKQFYSITNKKEYILQICLHNSQKTALLAANHATIVKQRIQPHLTKLPLSEVAANIAISNFTHAAAAGQLITSYNEDRLDQSSSKRHNDPKHCNKEVVQEFKHRDNRRQSRTVTDSRVVAQLYLILIIIDYTCYDKDRKHIAYIRAFSETLQAFKFYDLSTIIRPVHLVPRDLPNSTTYTTMSYYVNNYIN
ncbi:hypothetical protein HBI15_153260 [Parastagonospora nodorum]|nr:hypothetical protein HBI15_153260 [Parastagonospora nodorum]